MDITFNREIGIIKHMACLKKKEPQKKSTRPKKTWLEKQRPRKKKKESSKEVPEKQFDFVSYLPISL